VVTGDDALKLAKLVRQKWWGDSSIGEKLQQKVHCALVCGGQPAGFDDVLYTEDVLYVDRPPYEKRVK